MLATIIFILYTIMFIALILNQINKVDEFKRDKSLWKTVVDNFVLILGVALTGYFVTMVTLFLQFIEMDNLLVALIFEGILVLLSVINIIIFIIAAHIKKNG